MFNSFSAFVFNYLSFFIRKSLGLPIQFKYKIYLTGITLFCFRFPMNVWRVLIEIEYRWIPMTSDQNHARELCRVGDRKVWGNGIIVPIYYMNNKSRILQEQQSHLCYFLLLLLFILIINFFMFLCNCGRGIPSRSFLLKGLWTLNHLGSKSRHKIREGRSVQRTARVETSSKSLWSPSRPSRSRIRVF